MRTITDFVADYVEFLPPWWLVYAGLILGTASIVGGAVGLLRGRARGGRPIKLGLGMYAVPFVMYPVLTSAQLGEASRSDSAPAETSAAVDLSASLVALMIAASVVILLGAGVMVAGVVSATKRRRVEAKRSQEERAAR